MDPQNPLKQKITQIFRSSLSSCKSRDVSSDVVERPVSTRQHYQLMELFSPKPNINRSVNFSICGPKKRSEDEREETFPRRKVTKRRSMMLTCPPVSPVAPFDTWHECEGVKSWERKYYSNNNKNNNINGKKKKKKKSKGPVVDKKGRKKEKGKNKTTPWPTNFSNNNNYYEWSTSEDDDDDVDTDDDDETTLFSSKSLTSDSSVSSSRRFRQTKHIRDDPTAVSEGFAVVKRSNDPHSDFRTSMVEMIVEKQIFGARELEGLLNTFLSLNSCDHHRVIVEVFTEIWEALFSDWS